MGLDMYAFSTKAKPKTEVDFETKNFEPQDEVAYWRKHPNLHGWMQNLYDMKGGTSSDFNGDCVVLDSEDLDNLEADIREGNLPDTSGFFLVRVLMVMKKMKTICYLLLKQGKLLVKVRQYITQVGGNMKTIITKVLFILREWIEQHHEMERWNVRNYKKQSYDKK